MKYPTTLDSAVEFRDTCLQHGVRVGFTNGCFDLFHPGHLYFIKTVRLRCHRLIVGLNSDASVRKLKGAGRPVDGIEVRVMNLYGTLLVHRVVVFDEDTPEKIIRALRPDVLAKGDDYGYAEIVGADFVRENDGEVFRVPRLPGMSTTAIIKNRKP